MVWQSLSGLSYFREYPNKSLIIESTSELSSIWGCFVVCFFCIYCCSFSLLWKSLPLSCIFFLTKQIVATSSRRDLWSASFQISLITGIFPSFSQGSMVGCVHIAQYWEKPGKRKNISSFFFLYFYLFIYLFY